MVVNGSTVRAIVARMLVHVKSLPVVNEISTIDGGRCVVVGDLHGQWLDFITVLDMAGEPSPLNKIVFNGDIVDRGPHGVEVLFTVFCMVLAYPEYVYINRGNHEVRRMNEKYNFEDQVYTHYDYETFDRIIDLFDWLSLVTLVNNKIIILHGGLFQYDDVTLDDLRAYFFVLCSDYQA